MTVYLVDDEESVRRALGRLLRAEGFVVEAFASGPEFLAGCNASRPACAVLDMAMPECTGLDLQRALLDRGSTLPIVFLTGRADVPMCAQAMKSGAIDFLTKPVNDEELIAAVYRALESDRREQASRAESEEIRSRLALLTPREREVLDLVVTGRLNKQIGAELGAAEKTIKVHRGRVMEKMRVESVAELVRLMERASLDR
jgi:FixJ family two-component response regulator